MKLLKQAAIYSLLVVSSLCILGLVLGVVFYLVEGDFLKLLVTFGLLAIVVLIWLKILDKIKGLDQ